MGVVAAVHEMVALAAGASVAMATFDSPSGRQCFRTAAAAAMVAPADLNGSAASLDTRPPRSPGIRPPPRTAEEAATAATTGVEAEPVAADTAIAAATADPVAPWCRC